MLAISASVCSAPAFLPNTTGVLHWAGVSLNECKVGLTHDFAPNQFPSCPQVSARMSDLAFSNTTGKFAPTWLFRVTNTDSTTLNDLSINVTFNRDHEFGVSI